MLSSYSIGWMICTRRQATDVHYKTSLDAIMDKSGDACNIYQRLSPAHAVSSSLPMPTQHGVGR